MDDCSRRYAAIFKEYNSKHTDRNGRRALPPRHHRPACFHASSRRSRSRRASGTRRHPGGRFGLSIPL